MTCAPLINDDRYIFYDDKGWNLLYCGRLYDFESHEPQGTGRHSQESGYGRDITASGPPPQYKVRTNKFDPLHSSSLLPEFKAGNKIVFFILVSSREQIVHHAPRRDSIFPANSPIWFPPDDDAVNMPSIPKNVLGCWDQGNLFDAFTRTTNCKTPSAGRETDCLEVYVSELTKEQRDALYLLEVALNSSNAYDAIRYRSATGLDANKLFGRTWTLRLPEEQWKVEAEKLFQTSLARMQVDLFDFARGVYADAEGALNYAPQEFENAHTMLKLPVPGHKNVDGLWFVGINLFCVLVYLSSRRYSTPERRRDKIANGEDGGYHDNL
ncbi:hypothetical protein H2199_007831 [Coniosporium tulheliwenetii]|uniref:Uncharacterized protein n=1 Tax=Coniosporium tulheliwenetii TaxID=3383036 RepID=A0ACC2YN78_9PEZI|nr:hypothetical protein H2199_007831 [Cladosporium sp. JES 115]